jgi:hypothetical protein
MVPVQWQLNLPEVYSLHIRHRVALLLVFRDTAMQNFGLFPRAFPVSACI